MKPFTPALLQAAQTCALCHDQCVSACPVVETTRSLMAYPSRLATLAWEMARGQAVPDSALMLAMQQCIGCNACTAHCVYVDMPNDITPVVCWARQTLVDGGQATPAMQAMLTRIQSVGNPYGDVRPQLAQLTASAPTKTQPGRALLCADAATLRYAPHMARAALELLGASGQMPVTLAQHTYHGNELRQYGFAEAFRQTAQAVAGEIERSAAETAVTLSPMVAELLRRVYPAELGVTIQARVLTLAEAVDEWIAAGLLRVRREPRSVYLIVSGVEVFRSGAGAAKRVVERCGSSVASESNERPAWDITYPEGLALDLEPDPRQAIRQHLEADIVASAATEVVVTHAQAWHALRQIALPARLVDLPSYILEHLDPRSA